MTAWQAVVGIPLEDWERADTPEQVAWLVWLRDNPMPAPPQCPGDIEICSYDGQLVRRVHSSNCECRS